MGEDSHAVLPRSLPTRMQAQDKEQGLKVKVTLYLLSQPKTSFSYSEATTSVALVDEDIHFLLCPYRKRPFPTR